MPAASIHMSICKIINKKYKRGENFLIGNIAPDCWRHSLYHANKEKSHFIKNSIEDYNAFFEKYKNEMDDDFTFGYLVHLMTDNYWKKFVLPKYKINNQTVKLLNGDLYTGTIEEIKELLHINNQIATYNISKHFNLKLLNTNIKISCIIEEIDLSGLIKTIEHVNKVNFSKPFQESNMYIMSELYEEIEKCSQYLIETIDNLM